jgi:hypothetical protein
MFKVAEPAVALNDMRVGGHFQLSRSIKVRANDSRTNIVRAVASYAAGSPGGRLTSLVLNSHGLPGYLIMGEGFWQPHTSLFEEWAGLVSNVWITACSIASRCPTQGELPGWLKGQSSDGYLFCQEMARRARCNVIASLNDQDVPNHSKIPSGYIDAFEITLLCFRPQQRCCLDTVTLCTTANNDAIRAGREVSVESKFFVLPPHPRR